MFHFKSLVAAGAAALALSACMDTSTSTSASGAFDRNVIITNGTGRTIWRFYGSRVTTSSWEEDILGSSILPAGDSININFDDGTGSCMFDMKAEFRDGSAKIINNVNVCSVTRVTFR